ncbi:hypothetical protein [Shumkonia mesophila]|uniref:hypothetical protein n=1 Tax=Shumkonia mesophila TaxID=2838854 RepID=UPI002934F9BB|nr:hypothetical protein [Shumkonia mesophila]
MALASDQIGKVDSSLNLSDREKASLDGKPSPSTSGLSALLSNRGVALVLLVATFVLGTVIWNSEWAHERARDGFTLGGLPLFAVYSMAASLLILVVDRAATRPSGFKRESVKGVLIVVLAAVAVGVIFLSFRVVGFIPGIFAMVAAGSLLLGFRPAWIALAVGMVIAISLRLLLYALSVGVPDGPLGLLF